MMLPYRGAKLQRRRWIVGGAVIVLLGIALTITPLGDWFATLSYDVPFLFRSGIADTNVVVVLEDRASLDTLGEKSWPPSRTVHARLVERLREEGAKLVVFDILFRSERPGEDEMFAAAIKRHGNVILGCVPEMSAQQVGNLPGTLVAEFKPPVDALRTNAAGWGLLLVGNLDASYGVRKMTVAWKGMDAAIWLAAQRVGVLPAGEKADAERWINFYGAPPALDRLRLGEVLQLEGRRLPPGFLRGKIVFVGFDPSVTPASGARDLFATPYTRFGHDFAPGVEVLANACANLVCGDWLRRMALPFQCLLVVVFGIGSLALLIALETRRLIFGAVLLFALLLAVALSLQWHFGLWWNWLVPAFVELPLAALLAVLCPHLPRVAFISYRREGGEGFALAVLHSLWARGYEAFLDVQDISGGEWLPQILAGIERTPNVVLILSPGAFNEQKDGEPDWMCKEILHAFAKKKKIIPIVHEKFIWPKPLPKGMEKLPDQQVILHHPDHPGPTFDKLEEYLRSKTRTTIS